MIPLIARTQKSFEAWLRPAYGPIRLDYNVDRIDALAEERASEWTRVNAATFLTDDEKRAAVGYGKKPGGAAFPVEQARVAPAAARAFNPNQPRVPARNRHGGRWTKPGGGGGPRPAESGDEGDAGAIDAGDASDIGRDRWSDTNDAAPKIGDSDNATLTRVADTTARPRDWWRNCSACDQ